MAVTVEDLAELRKLGEARHDGALQPLETITEIIGYSVSLCRAENIDEAVGVETLCRAARLERADVLEAERTLRPLGYRLVAGRLKQLARRKRCF